MQAEELLICPCCGERELWVTEPIRALYEESVADGADPDEALRDAFMEYLSHEGEGEHGNN